MRRAVPHVVFVRSAELDGLPHAGPVGVGKSRWLQACPPPHDVADILKQPSELTI